MALNFRMMSLEPFLILLYRASQNPNNGIQWDTYLCDGKGKLQEQWADQVAAAQTMICHECNEGYKWRTKADRDKGNDAFGNNGQPVDGNRKHTGSARYADLPAHGVYYS
jgi:hypothetical protein